MSAPRRVSPSEAKQLMEDGYIYVDVRTEAEWAAGHPAGAHNVPFMLAGPGGMVPNPEFMNVVEKLYDKEQKLVLGCKSGGRSLRAATAMLTAGFREVVDQRAGWDGSRNSFGQVSEQGWHQAGLPSEPSTPGASYAELKARLAR